MRGSMSPAPLPSDDAYLLLERDLLDQQIIESSTCMGTKWCG
jgi:hypothetical protein